MLVIGFHDQTGIEVCLGTLSPNPYARRKAGLQVNLQTAQAWGRLRDVKAKPFGCAARSLDISTAPLKPERLWSMLKTPRVTIEESTELH